MENVTFHPLEISLQRHMRNTCDPSDHVIFAKAVCCRWALSQLICSSQRCRLKGISHLEVCVCLRECVRVGESGRGACRDSAPAVAVVTSKWQLSFVFRHLNNIPHVSSACAHPRRLAAHNRLHFCPQVVTFLLPFPSLLPPLFSPPPHLHLCVLHFAAAAAAAAGLFG